MKYKRKTRHDYWKFNLLTQESYLNIRYQIGYLEAGRYLKRQICMEELVPLFYHLALVNETLKIIKRSNLYD